MPSWIGAIEPVARIAVATLFNSLWEAALLALAVALILRVLPNLNATTRYALWCIALVGSLLLPLATALPQISVQHPAASKYVAVTSAPVNAVPAKKPARQAASGQAAPKPAEPAQHARPAFRLPERLHFALPEWVALALFVVWGVATLFMLIRLGVNLWRLERLKTDALPLPVDYRDRLARWSEAEKGGRDVRLCICDRIEVPVAVGLFDSMILIPQHLLESLSQEEIDQIMLHELAHLRRADDWTNGLQRVIQALFFFNPAVLFIAQQLDVEREVACDDWVVHQTREVRPYATCLTKMAEVTAWPHRALAAPGVFVTRRGLSVRVERLLRAGRNVRTSIAFGPAGGAVAALVVLFFILQTVAPSFAFTLPQTKAAPPPVVAVASPKPISAPRVQASPKPVIEKQIIYVKPAPQAPSVHVTTPHQLMHKVVVHVHPSVPMPPNPVLPPDFEKNVSALTAKSIHVAMQSADPSGMQAGDANCIGCDYSGQNLSGHNFRNQRMNGSDFSRANLQNADFTGAVLVGADFTGANLRGASFVNAKLTGCDLKHADLTGVNFTGAEIIGCDVNASSLSATQAGTLLRACRSGCDFTRANLQNQDLHGLSLTGVDLSKADLRGANLSGVNFSGVDFSHARMDGARVDGARFTGCDFSGVDLHNVDISKAIVVGTRFSQ